jgi:acyl carrier protein
VVTLPEAEALVRRELRGKSAGVTLDEYTPLADLGLSSLQVAEIIFSLEEEHEIEFDAAQAADITTLGELVTLANEALEAATPLVGPGYSHENPSYSNEKIS